MSEVERIIHNGEIIDPIPGVYTEPLPAGLSLEKSVPQTVEDIDPEILAGLMAKTISDAMSEEPVPAPMEIVTRLFKLKTLHDHKVIWSRFDMHQLFALWTNKLDRQKHSR